MFDDVLAGNRQGEGKDAAGSGQSPHKPGESSKNPRFYWLLALLVAQVVADGYITRFLVMQGLAGEANPFLKTWVGSDALLSMKLIGAMLVAVVLWRMYGTRSRMALMATSLAVTFYAVVIFWNVFVFFIA
jgi:hypothetical protein